LPKNNENRYHLADFFGMMAFVRWAFLLLSPSHILLWWFLAGFPNPAFFLAFSATCGGRADVTIKKPRIRGVWLKPKLAAD